MFAKTWTSMPAGLQRVVLKTAASAFGISTQNLESKLSKAQMALSSQDFAALYDRLIAISSVGHGTLSWSKKLTDIAESNLQPIVKMMLADLISYMRDDVLVKVDRASMATQLEVRAPLLDINVFRYSAALPLEAKVKNGVGKLPLRQLLREEGLEHVLDKPKTGFALPMWHWLRQDLKTWGDERLFAPQLYQYTNLKRQDVETIWKHHVDGTTDAQHYIWSLCVLSEWLVRRFS
jgi:asparagine synthase (glutamine-hydrolysing)